MHDMTSVAPTVCRALMVRPPSSAEGSLIIEAAESLNQIEKLVVVVIDAFGVSTWEKAKENTPVFNKLRGVHGTVIRSVMPSITPVNFATMLTGASPETHGIRNREQPLRHENIFHVMRETGMVSATAARAVSSLGILISPHADKPGLAGSNLDSEVTEIACRMIDEEVNLLWVQLLDVDDAGHSHGPYSLESREAAAKADTNLMRILEAARVHGYSAIVLADHGQHPSSGGPYKGVHGTTVPEDLNVPFLWASNTELREALDE
jgi:predicted AlkP superfamily pyrophosphatase or phosphodiesterase